MATRSRKRRGKTDRGHRSKLEDLVAILVKDYNYETEVLNYIYPETKKRYLPDFTKDHVVIEAKGRFTAADRKKMLLVQEQFPDRAFLMVFGRAQNTLSKKSKTTYGDWCTKNNLSWVDILTFKKDYKQICQLLTMKQKIFGNLPILPNKKKPR